MNDIAVSPSLRSIKDKTDTIILLGPLISQQTLTFKMIHEGTSPTYHMQERDFY